jgi:lantibiotic transport system permease protein
MLFLFRGLQTEWIKARRSFVVIYVLLCPLLLASLLFLVFYFRPTADIDTAESIGKANYWTMLLLGGYNSLSHLFLPLFIVLLNVMLYTREHQGNMWKHLYALPTPRWSVYGAKSLFGLLLLWASFVLFFVFVILVGYSVDLIKPAYKFSQTDMLLTEHLVIAARIFVNSLGIWAIHNWLSLRFKGVGISMGIAIISIVATPLVELGASKMGNWRFLYPYICPSEVMQDMMRSKDLYNWGQLETLSSLAYLFIFLLLGYWEYSRNRHK